MVSQWNNLKEAAIDLRRSGISIVSIEKSLGIPRSTLSGWFREIKLTDGQQKVLASNKLEALKKARIGASKFHRLEKERRVERIMRNAHNDLEGVETGNFLLLEVALSMLYLGEGSKAKPELGLGNSDPKIMRFYVSALETLYSLPRETLRADLHLRADQNEVELKSYWSDVTSIPLERFTYVVKDKRTEGRPTYPSYKGVCYVRGGGVEIQRRLMYLAEVLCSKNYSRD